ncbi:MAG: hypothetical protein R3F10_03650 [Lysobacteraceae bacterium]
MMLMKEIHTFVAIAAGAERAFLTGDYGSQAYAERVRAALLEHLGLPDLAQH